jgi:hypothetical protein
MESDENVVAFPHSEAQRQKRGRPRGHFLELMRQPPAVTWDSPEDPARITDADTIEREVKWIVLDLWARLPEGARTIIAHHLKGVKLMPVTRDEPPEDFVEGYYCLGNLVLFLQAQEAFGAWEAQVRAALASGFSRVFWRSLVVLVPEELPRTAPATGKPRDGLEVERSAGRPWLLELLASQPDYGDRLLPNMIDALVLAWGLAEEAVATMPIEAIHRPSTRRDMGGLGWLIRKAHRVLERRLREARP